MPYRNTALAKYIRDCIEHDPLHRSHVEIAAEAGYDSPSMLTMLKNGRQRLPLNRVSALARALRADLVTMFGLAIQQYIEREQLLEILKLLGAPANPKQQVITRRIVEILGDAEPELTEELDAKLVEVFSPYVKKKGAKKRQIAKRS
jgi:hypothetical protein